MKYLMLISAYILTGTGMIFGQMIIIDLNDAESPKNPDVLPILEFTNNPYKETDFDFTEIIGSKEEFDGSAGIGGFNFLAEVPEPSTYGIIGACFLAGLIYFRRRKLS